MHGTGEKNYIIGLRPGLNNYSWKIIETIHLLFYTLDKIAAQSILARLLIRNLFPLF